MHLRTLFIATEGVTPQVPRNFTFWDSPLTDPVSDLEPLLAAGELEK
jgi:hypothetical protein